MQKSVEDFEDLLELFSEHNVRYLIVGGLAFIFHAKPRYTKDMDLWLDGSAENLEKANRALIDFGSPSLLELYDPEQILQIGVAPNRIDLLVHLEGVSFSDAWGKKIKAEYGGVHANWIDAESLWAIKSIIAHPRHQEDARVLKQILDKNSSV